MRHRGAEPDRRSRRRALFRPRIAIGLSSCCLLAACGGGGGGASAPPSTPLLASADIGPDGGRLEVGAGPHAGTALVVPPGAVGGPTRFSIALSQDDPELPSLFPVYRFEPSALAFGLEPATVVVCYGEALDNGGNAPALALFGRADGAPLWNAYPASTVDTTDGTVSADVPRLGRFAALDGNLHRLFTQTQRLIEPAAAARVEQLTGVQFTTGNGSTSVQIGRGSLASFWQSPAESNVLIVPGLLGSPADFLGPDDLAQTLPPSVQNVVLLDYPTARGVAFAANALYDEIVLRRGPSFGCTIVGHSMGGLIGRYLLERSHQDPARAGFVAGDPPLGATVENLILLATPNDGAAFATAALQTLLPLLEPDERFFLQAVRDLSGQSDSVTTDLNLAYVDNATRYHVVYGDIGGGTDGVITVASALALPLTAPETATMFALQHDDLHRLAGSGGVAAWIQALITLP